MRLQVKQLGLVVPLRQLEGLKVDKLLQMQEMHLKMEVLLVRPELVPKVQQGRRLRSTRVAQEVELIVVRKTGEHRD